MKRVIFATNGIDNDAEQAYMECMITYYLVEMLSGEYQIVGYDGFDEVSRETYFHLYIARQHLAALEDDGNVCIDTLMAGY